MKVTRYEVSLDTNGVGSAVLADGVSKKFVQEYFESKGDKVIGVSESNSSRKPGQPLYNTLTDDQKAEVAVETFNEDYKKEGIMVEGTDSGYRMVVLVGGGKKFPVGEFSKEGTGELRFLTVGGSEDLDLTVEGLVSALKSWSKKTASLLKNRPIMFPTIKGQGLVSSIEYRCKAYHVVCGVLGISDAGKLVKSVRDALYEGNKGNNLREQLFDSGKYVDVVEFCGLGGSKGVPEESLPAEGKTKLPDPEITIKANTKGSKDLKSFVQAAFEELKADHDFTTFFIDTPQEYEKYDVSIPAVCLVVADKRSTKASLKKEPIVRKFDKSKTLKRYSDWKKDERGWYTIYVSAVDARNQGIKALSEDIEEEGLFCLGYLDEEGDIVRRVTEGDIVEYEGEYYAVTEVDGQFITITNETDEHEVNETELEMVRLELDEEVCYSLGEGMLLLGYLEEQPVVCDGNENVYKMEH